MESLALYCYESLHTGELIPLDRTSDNSSQTGIVRLHAIYIPWWCDVSFSDESLFDDSPQRPSSRFELFVWTVSFHNFCP